MPITFELKVVSDNLTNAPKNIRALASQVVQKTAFDIEAQAKLIVPVDTGFLKNSIETQFVSDLEYLVTVGAEYGIYVEMGTRYKQAQPFLQPAAEQAAIPFEAAMVQVLDVSNWSNF